jgi:DNA-binding transcriptional regulator PaaX
MNKIKESEARIIVYLSMVPNTKKHVSYICQKLGMNYSYTLIVLREMVGKGWLAKHKHGRYMSYDLTTEAPMDLAKQWYLMDEAQRKINCEQEQITTRPLTPEEEAEILESPEEDEE